MIEIYTLFATTLLCIRHNNIHAQICLPNLVVVYVACRNNPADKPVYNVRKPSFLTTPISTDADDGLERSETTQTCILFLTKSSGWTKHVANILKKIQRLIS